MKIKESGKIKSSLKSIECVCPRCRIRHKIKFNWVGSTKPWKYCPSCKAFQENNSHMLIDGCRISTPSRKSRSE